MDNKTPTTGIDYNSCSTTSWSSKTSLSCYTVVGWNNGVMNDVVITSTGIVGTRSGLFTFDAPAVSYVGVDNFGRSHTGSLSVTGVNFGQTDNTPSTRIDTNECGTAGWVSATAVYCHNSVGPTMHTTEVTVAVVAGTRMPAFTFDGPHLPSIPLPFRASLLPSCLPPSLLQRRFSATRSAPTAPSPRRSASRSRA